MAVSLSSGAHIRSPLARVLYMKMAEDQVDETRDHSYWYRVGMQNLPEDLQLKFVQFNEDDETRQFIVQSRKKSDRLFTELLHSFLKFLLSWVLHQTSINGLLQRGSMFVFSQSQIQQFLNVPGGWRARRMIDLGAGDGMVTRRLAQYFDEVYVTETSTAMVWRLRQQNYKVLDVADWHSGEEGRFDLISCLNLLDRCSHPVALLRQMRVALAPRTGRLLLALVLPFSPYVEDGAAGVNHEPHQWLHVAGRTFEEQVVSLVQDIFHPAGYELERFSRLPYLCEGDLQHSYYVLHDALFLLRTRDEHKAM